MLDLLEESGNKLEKLLRRTSVAGAPWSVVEGPVPDRIGAARAIVDPLL